MSFVHVTQSIIVLATCTMYMTIHFTTWCKSITNPLAVSTSNMCALWHWRCQYEQCSASITIPAPAPTSYTICHPTAYISSDMTWQCDGWKDEAFEDWTSFLAASKICLFETLPADWLELLCVRTVPLFTCVISNLCLRKSHRPQMLSATNQHLVRALAEFSLRLSNQLVCESMCTIAYFTQKS